MAVPEPAPLVASYEKSGYREMPRLQDPRVLKLTTGFGIWVSLVVAVETAWLRLLLEEREVSLRTLRIVLGVVFELLVRLWRN